MNIVPKAGEEFLFCEATSHWMQAGDVHGEIRPMTALGSRKEISWACFGTLFNEKGNTRPCYRPVFSVTGGFLYAATGPVKRVTGRIFKISKCFHRSKEKL
jgi:hypothetical protein